MNFKPTIIKVILYLLLVIGIYFAADAYFVEYRYRDIIPGGFY